MTYRLSQRSERRLEGVHFHLIKVVRKAIELTTVDFAVLEGLRTEQRQKRLVQIGASRTMNSRHLTGHAVDLGAWVDGSLSWDWRHYHKIAEAMKQAATELKVPLEWGGDWRSFKDGPHFQLPWSEYPIEK